MIESGARVEDTDQLDTLPVETVIFDVTNRQAAQREEDGWYYTGDGRGHQVVQLPAIILRLPLGAEKTAEDGGR